MHATRGLLVLVVGPSGAGKDTLLGRAREALGNDPEFRFVRRVITRPAAIGEDHEPVSPEEFKRRVAEGAFALRWNAHGLRYGLPAEIDDWLSNGIVVIANGSRAALSAARRKYPDLRTIGITASPEILAERLARRGRESAKELAARLSRSKRYGIVAQDMVRIDNSGPPDVSGERLVAVLLGCRSVQKH